MDDEEVYEDDQQRFEAEVQQWQQQEQHEDEQMLTRKDFLNELVKKNHLVEEDIFPLPIGGKKISIITRTGIEKIQYHNNIDVTAYANYLGVQDRDRKTILYAPTWKWGAGTLHQYGYKFCQELTKEYNLIIRPHYFDRKYIPKFKYWAKSKGQNIYIFRILRIYYPMIQCSILLFRIC